MPTLLSMKFILILIVSILWLNAFGQVDTIYLNNQKIAANVKEVTPDAIKFTYPNEDVLNSIYKNSIKKIIFKSGRVQTFTEINSLKNVKSVNDWQNVSISYSEKEILGLYKLADVSSKAKGGTTVDNADKIKDRAIKKLKIQAAMNGGNIVFLTQIDSRAAEAVGGGSIKKASTSLSAIAYSNVVPDVSKFQDKLRSKKLPLINKIYLHGNAKDIFINKISGYFVVSSIDVEGDFLYITGTAGNSKEIKFRLVSFDDTSFTVVYESETTLYNYVISFI